MSAIGMSGMASTFSTGTQVTLWFTGWTTTTTATYVSAVFLLFLLGIFNRFLGALKSQLERKWKMQRGTKTAIPSSVYTKKTADSSRGHTRTWSDVLRAQHRELKELEKEEIEPLTPVTAHTREDEESGTNAKSDTSRIFWLAHAPWSIDRDGISAGLEFVRALIGYVLMLAVMTYNIGFLFSVTGSVLLGELLFGRYTRGSATLAEDGCHP
ncbi:Ctr copper transporter family protein [Pyrenophora tritici-repentis]|nr:uncharacterized protein PTRG_06054 [Pyrenophora tritici-repentis Pt-1C-BFP]EDU48974.1 conserved hypothetical protein [Pyrenophora tritici-repentis Pt-1C-BFP]KAF7570217.1 Ctr copper transporter family protein [Pyrenophora tritici-repentis]